MKRQRENLNQRRTHTLSDYPLAIGKAFETRDRRELRREFIRCDLHNAARHLRKLNLGGALLDLRSCVDAVFYRHEQRA